ncbi:MAG: transposase family protein, partial [Methylocella sp.]
LNRAMRFYDEICASLGAKRLYQMTNGCVGVMYGVESGPTLGVVQPFDCQLATSGNGVMVALPAASPECVDRVHTGCASISVQLALPCIVCRLAASNVMKTLASWAPAPNLTVIAVEAGELDWIVSVDGRDAEQDRDRACCPLCGIKSSSRHSSYTRTLRDLSAQGRPVNIQARLTRWRCRNDHCERRIFAERLPTLAIPFARRTTRLAGIVKLFGHSVGGRSSERLMARLGMPVSDITILRSVKASAGAPPNRAVVRVAGVDEWAWRKGMTFGTVIVDLERRQVVELLAVRSHLGLRIWNFASI